MPLKITRELATKKAMTGFEAAKGMAELPTTLPPSMTMRSPVLVARPMVIRADSCIENAMEPRL